MKGQALVELALCAPVVLVLALGAVTTVQVIEGETGLQAATSAALSAAVRAPDAVTAVAVAQSTFTSVISGYPVRSPRFTVMAGGFARGSLVTADSTAMVDVAAGVIALHAHSAVRVEPWRSRP